MEERDSATLAPGSVARGQDAVNASPMQQSAVTEESAVDAYYREMDKSGKRRDGPLRILMATEYLPPYVSGIANRCKNLIKGYKENGHIVTVAGPSGTNADIIVPSIPNVFYNHQRMFILPPLGLLFQLLNFFQEVPYDIIHVVGPLCFAFLFLLPLFKLRGIKIYVSYHVYLEYYKNLYFANNEILAMFVEGIFTYLYFIPLVWFADTVGIPSKTADSVVYKHSRRIHFMKSGLDTAVFKPLPENHFPADDNDVNINNNDEYIPIPTSLLPIPGAQSTSTPLTRQQAIKAATARSSSSVEIKLDPILVYVGRLAVEKNIEFLITSLSHPSLSRASLVIVGDGPIRASLEALAIATAGADQVFSYSLPDCSSSRNDDAGEHSNEQKQLQREFGVCSTGKGPDGRRYRILFAGMVRDEHEVASAYYARADCFVSASGSETFGFTVAEAMACGTPAVVVRAGAFASVYRMIDGWMFAEEDVDDFAGRVIRVVGDGLCARRIARRISVKGFSVDAAIRDLLKTYQWCVDGAEAGGISREKKIV